MQIKLHNQSGQEIGTVELPEEVFGVEVNPTVLHQVTVAQRANMRQVIAHTKDRSEVRGGGRKPWRQKGTGRARHGSRRSPIWVGGGVTFGPTRFRNFDQKINKKVKKKAILMALSGKVRDGEMIVVDKVNLSAPKTKEMAQVVDSLISDFRSTLFMIPERNEAIQRAGKNIDEFKVINSENINVVDLLNHKYLVLVEDCINKLKEKYGTV
jgi:large subunit ribosomal protein L4